MEVTPLVSIFCPTYNHEKYIKQCLDGFVNQKTNFQIEVIVQDDASTDNTSLIVREFAEKYSFIIPRIHEVNIFSQGKNLNEYFYKNARGKYVAICEGDDYWTDPYKLQKQVDFLEANDQYSMCFHEVELISDNTIVGIYSNLSKETFTTEDFFDRHIVATCSMLFRNILVFPSWSSKVASGDKLLIFLLSIKGKIKFINENMGVYRLHSGGISNTHVGIKKVYDMSVLLSLFDEYTNFEYHDNCMKSLLHEIEVHIVPNYCTNYALHDTIKNYKTIKLIKELFLRGCKKMKSILILKR